jgi:hypothetical protein
MLASFWATWASGRQPRLSGVHVAGFAVATLVATAAVPPAFGWGLNQWRVDATQQRAQLLAEQLNLNRRALVARAAVVKVACGPGRLPDPGPTGQWVGRAVQATGVFPEVAPTDAWGRCLLVNLDGFVSGGPVWVMSAGPDGRIGTFPADARTHGDDIGVRIQ